MMVNDPIGDMLAQIKNAYMAGKSVVALPHSKVKESVARILAEEGYLTGVAVKEEHIGKTLELTLCYQGTTPALTDVKRKSKPGLRVYIGSDAIPTVVGGMGIAILSTPLGIMTGKRAKKKHLGGELLCEVW
ncbi:30S ribosomal protein S8 [Candidatus Gottesmanbacteria bacterium]|nr:30S ribosomal protein S8 [Candidatus Gottesmanbacteria bacterium]